MKFAIIGGDRRQCETALFLKRQGHDVKTFGLPYIIDLCSVPSLFDAINGCDSVVLPLPVTRDGSTVNTPLTVDVIFLQDILSLAPKNVFGGMISEELANEFTLRNIKYFDYFKSEPLTVKNAVLTAEAAIGIAISSTDFSIFGSKSLVLGYGRIGRQLAKYLKVLGSDVTATSRKEGVLANILADGITPQNTKNAHNICQQFDYIFNTIPYPILDRDFFKNCQKHVFVEDLATNSNIDLESAHEFNIRAAVYGGLPGKHSPISAAEYIAYEILNKI